VCRFSKAIVLSVSLLILVLSLSSCTKPRIAGKSDNIPLKVIPKDSEQMKEAVRVIKDNMVFFRKDNRCFSVVIFRSGDSRAIASVSAVNCNDFE
jgi:hypothetical protein